MLTDRGAFLRSRSGWHFVPYGEVEDVCFPEKTDPDGSLTLRTSVGSFQMLRRCPELWDAGRFFMRCASDAKGVNLALHRMAAPPRGLVVREPQRGRHR